MIATKPNSVWSWDITKLKGPTKGTYYCLYVVIDIFSRFVVGFTIAKNESSEIAKEMIEYACFEQNIEPDQLTLHSDRGSPMTSGSLIDLFSFLGISQSLSRPRTSNDNPYSEAQFKTLKYFPDYPEKFESLKEAKDYIEGFLHYYNYCHYHSGIGYQYPSSVHFGHAETIRDKRAETLSKAYTNNPIRFRNISPDPVSVPSFATINYPNDKKEEIIEQLDKTDTDILISTK